MREENLIGPPGLRRRPACNLHGHFPESFNDRGGEFGEQRLIEALRRHHKFAVTGVARVDC